MQTTNQVRRILYVDASFNSETKQSKICLYDKELNKLDTLTTNIPTSSSIAERYAIVYACLYAKKYNLLNNKIHILSDNYSATINPKIKDLCSRLNISLSWIPREINEIANNGTQNECNIDNEYINVCNLFYELIMEINIENQKTIETQVENQNINNNEKNILINAFQKIKIQDKPYIALGQIGKYLKQNHKSLQYKSLKQLLEKYPNDFQIVNKNYVKLYQ